MDLKQRIWRLGMSLVIGVGVYYGVFAVSGKWVFALRERPENLPEFERVEGQETPEEIAFLRLKKSVPVKPARAEGDSWQVFDDAAAWLADSAVVGKGNTIIYAHNTSGLFGDLNMLEEGDVIRVGQGDWWFDFRVAEVAEVRPDQVEVLAGESERLTLYTCEGSFDQKRLVVYAEAI